jgi:hypothetical protein
MVTNIVRYCRGRVPIETAVHQPGGRAPRIVDCTHFPITVPPHSRLERVAPSFPTFMYRWGTLAHKLIKGCVMSPEF